MNAVNRHGSVVRIGACDLAVVPGTWQFADQHRTKIAAHWARRTCEGARFYDGVIHLMQSQSLSGSDFTARFVRTDFKSYLYWRDSAFPEAGVADAFGSALIRSGEGHVLLGRQRKGNMNAGLSYLPGGFIDARDVRQDGTIDIEASIDRELREETGLSAAALDRVPGYVLTFAGPLVSIGAEFRSSLFSEALRDKILDHIRTDPDSELADIVIARSARDLGTIEMPDYAAVLLRSLLHSA